MSPAGRRPGSPPTRQEILVAGRAEFTAAGYNAASVRRVARRAGVDAALVYHYFADKARLFVACFDLPADPRTVQAEARGARPDGARIIERFLAQWEDGDGAPGRSFVTLVQAVSGAPEVADALREFLFERVWANRPDADRETTRITVALVSSQLLGLAWARYVVRMEPIASAPLATVAGWAAPGIDAVIAGRSGHSPPPGEARRRRR
ncbi:MAG: TetR family transcriptional regulator [Acidimicrobiales bacterium]